MRGMYAFFQTVVASCIAKSLLHCCNSDHAMAVTQCCSVSNPLSHKFVSVSICSKLNDNVCNCCIMIMHMLVTLRISSSECVASAGTKCNNVSTTLDAMTCENDSSLYFVGLAWDVHNNSL